MDQNILVVDDDQQVTSFLQRFFRKHGYSASVAATSSAMFEAVAADRFDLVILDLILPDEDGFDAAKKLRSMSDVPIIMLTARDEVFDRIVGLELGADDYVTKPYEPRELLARVRSVLRRYGNGASEAAEPSGTLSFEGFELNLVRSNVTRRIDGADLGLTGTEFALLRAMAEARGDTLTREDILSKVYGNSVQITDRAIDAHVARLRRKLSASGAEPDLIRTVHGVGYKLSAAVSRG